jgi:hypothetical protein
VKIKSKKDQDETTDDSTSQKWKEGVKVEARFKGRSRYYPGVISRCRLNGTYDIEYDDGEKETGIKKDLIRTKSGGVKKNTHDPDNEDEFSVGAKVSAKCNGSRAYYTGKIKSDNGDDTFDIAFDDGDRDRRVPKSNIKSDGGGGVKNSPKRAQGSDNEDEFSIGAKVSAKCKGSRAYYTGKIKSDNGEIPLPVTPPATPLATQPAAPLATQPVPPPQIPPPPPTAVPLATQPVPRPQVPPLAPQALTPPSLSKQRVEENYCGNLYGLYFGACGIVVLLLCLKMRLSDEGCDSCGMKNDWYEQPGWKAFIVGKIKSRYPPYFSRRRNYISMEQYNQETLKFTAATIRMSIWKKKTI